MMNDLTYEQARGNASAYKQIGETRIYLYNSEAAPWGKATACKSGGLHRLDLDVSARFSFSEDGLLYEWSWNLESREANGKGVYEIDVESCKAVMKRLCGDAKIQFREYLSDCAKKVQAKGGELMDYANKQLTDAAILRDLAAQE